jgi:hypothetical protein
MLTIGNARFAQGTFPENVNAGGTNSGDKAMDAGERRRSFRCCLGVSFYECSQ